MTYQCRVYYEDTDAAGVVYYANYLKFAERARTEAVRVAGLSQHALLDEQGLGFVVTHVEVAFHRSARFDDLLTITTEIRDIGHASLTLAQTFLRADERLVSLQVRLALVNRAGKPVRLKDPLKTLLVHAFTQ